MIRSKLLALGCTLTLLSADVEAVSQSDINTAVAQLQSDSTLLSGWLADQFRYVIPFNSTSGAVVPSQLKLFGFELGVNAAVSGTKVDVDGLRQLGTSVINANEIDTMSRFPMPAIIAHAKIGLPFGMDGGVRFGGIPEKEFDEDDTKVKVKNKIIGIDVRKVLVEEGVAKPFGLTLGVSYTHADGDVTATSPYSAKSGTTVSNGGNNYSTSLNATGTNTMEWDTNSWGAQILMNKQLLFFNPYIGASATRNFGSISNRLGTAGNVTLTNVANSADTFTQAFSTSGSASRDPNKWDIRALVGAELGFLPFMKLGLHGEYAGSKNIGGSLGLRIQFR